MKTLPCRCTDECLKRFVKRHNNSWTAELLGIRFFCRRKRSITTRFRATATKWVGHGQNRDTPMSTRFLAIIIACLPSLALGEEPRTEADFQRELCRGPFEREVVQPNGTRVDCISRAYAIEIDFSEKWAEALGQALSYSASTGKMPAIFLICRGSNETCHRHLLRLQEAITHWDLPVEVWPIDGTRTSSDEP